MGDPKKVRKQYSMPSHMWQKARIDEERPLLDSYGLVNKREIWKASTILKNFAKQAKKLIAFKGKQSDLESEQLLQKLGSLGLIKSKSLESVLDIELRNILDRRLQTVVFRKGLARSINQARQMITHAHVAIEDKKITAPSYLVSVEEEEKLSFVGKSPFAKADHPERVVVEAKAK